MIIDLATSAVPTDTAEAVLVVGAGAAGLALALELGDAGRRVVLLEAGGDVADDFDGATDDHLDEADVIGLPMDPVRHRARVLGGSTQRWKGQCMRLHATDLEHRPWVPRSGWPIGLDDLADGYVRAERFFGVSGRGYGAGRWAEHPALAPVPWSAEHLEHDVTEYSPHPFMGTHLRSRLAVHPHVQVLLHAVVAAVHTEGDRAVGVRLARSGGRRELLPGRQVVLAGGALENPRLLMLSDPAGVGLGTGRRHTGRYLQDHAVVRTALVHSVDPAFLRDRHIVLRPRGLRQRERIFPKVRLSDRAQREHGLLGATAVFEHEFDDAGLGAARRWVEAVRRGSRPDRPLGDALSGARAVAPLTRDVYRRLARGLPTGAVPRRVALQIWVEQVPDPDSRLTLSTTTTDVHGLPRAVIDWRSHPLERRTSRQLTEWVGADLRRLGIARLERLAPQSDDRAWREEVRDGYHPAGTARMAVSAADGVVDPDLAVHGVAGLHVLGSSAFPVAGYGNPTLTIVALAHRLADRLLGRRAGAVAA